MYVRTWLVCIQCEGSYTDYTNQFKQYDIITKFIRGLPHPAPLSHLVHIDSLALSAGLQPTNEGHTVAGLTLELPVADQHGNEQSLACDIHPGRYAI